MLPEARREAWWRGAGTVPVEGRADQIDRLTRGVSHGDPHSPRQKLRIVEDVGVVPHLGTWHPRPGQSSFPGFGRSPNQDVFEDRFQLLAMFDPVGIAAEAAIVGKPGLIEHIAERPPLPIVADRDDQPAVGRAILPIGDDLGMGVSLARDDLAVAKIRLGDVDLAGDGAIEQGKIDVIAMA